MFVVVGEKINLIFRILFADADNMDDKDSKQDSVDAKPAGSQREVSLVYYHYCLLKHMGDLVLRPRIFFIGG